MSKYLFTKVSVILALIALLVIPLSLIEGQVHDRAEKRQTVVADIARTTAGFQEIVGPILVVPYKVRRMEQEEVLVHQDGKVNTVVRTKEVITDHLRLILPSELSWKSNLKTQTLYRGLYQARTYTTKGQITGQFELDFADLASAPTSTVGEPYLALGISDVRGIRNTLTLAWQDQQLTFLPGARLKSLGSGVHLPLPGLRADAKGKYTFALPLELLGTESLSFVPVGKANRVELAADWPHPSFFGDSLPASRTVTDSGFSAQWQSTWFNTDISQLDLGSGDTGPSWSNKAFGVRLIEPTDDYQQTERALKYAILFVLLTFSAFFLFEILRRLPIHPMQYALVGAALAMFYLLLLALSEHLPMATAFVVASSACVALIGVYLTHVLQHWLAGTGFAAGLALLYAMLYGLLQSEDSALLLGALLLFAALASIMLLTRKLNWYTVSARAPLPADLAGPQ